MADNINQSIEDLKTAIDEFTACCKAKGQTGGGVVEPPPSGGEVEVGPEEQFPDAGAYLDAKCNVSNAIYDWILGVLNWMDINNVDLIAGAFGGVSVGISLALMTSGPVGWTVLGIDAAISILAVFVITYALDWDDMKDALGDVHEEAVLAFYAADTASGARLAFLAALDGATPTLSTIAKQFIGLLVSYASLNQLFFPNDDLATYESPDPIVCQGWTEVFDFTIDNQGWENNADDSRPFGVYDPGVGWKSVWGQIGNWDERLYMRLDSFTPPDTITSIAVTYLFDGECGGGSGHVMRARGGTGSCVVGNESLPCEVGFLNSSGVGSMADPTYITSQLNGAAASDGSVEITLTSVTLTGTGSNPF